MLSGKYDDDFESTFTAETEDAGALSQSQDVPTDVAGPGEDEPNEGNQSDCESSGGEEDALTVSFEDIGALRRSLEQDETIKESLASARSNVSIDVSSEATSIQCTLHLLSLDGGINVMFLLG